VGMWRWLNRRKRADRKFLVFHVMARHAAWFPVHNHGHEAPDEAWSEWERRLQHLSEHELILFLTDNRARNRLLGKTWPPLTMISEKKEVP